MNEFCLHLFVLLFFQSRAAVGGPLGQQGNYGKVACTIKINGDLTEPQPLLVKPNPNENVLEDAFYMPPDKDGLLSFSANDVIDLSCPGSFLQRDSVNTHEEIVQATCYGGSTFTVQHLKTDFDMLNCSNQAKHQARYTGRRCGGRKYREIEIGFKINSRKFVRLMEICFDDELLNTVYSRFNLTPAIAGYQYNYPRPAFDQGNFYNIKHTNVNSLYVRRGQKRMINRILGLPDNSTKYIHDGNDSDYYLARGHLTAKTDFIFGSHQRATFYYVNAAPQWQTLNKNNWNVLEQNVREYAIKRDAHLDVYTGTFGVATLDDVRGREQQLYLYNQDGRKALPVPRYYWKVVYNPKTKAGAAFVSFNNPYARVLTRDVFCETVCDQIKWVKWHPVDVVKGVSFCCEVDHFRNVVEDLPEFKTKGLLR